MFKFIFFFIASTVVIFVKAEDIQALKQKYAEMVMECAKDYPLEPSDIEQLKNRQMPDKESAKCLFACAYKRSGIMSDDGKLSVEGTNKLAQTYLADNPDRLQKAQEFTEACKYVNDLYLSDGSKGCERAALIFKCSVERSEEFGFMF